MAYNREMPHNKKMTLFVIGIVLIIIACVGAWWFFFAHRMNPPLPEQTVQIVANPASTTATSLPAGENPSLPTEPLQIDNATFTVEIASTLLQKTDGLSFRPGLDDGHGMLFLFDTPAIQNFWMKDMNFPIDMIWIGGGKVLGFAQNAEPQPGAQLWQLTIYSSPDGTDQVLEVPAGTVTKDGIKVGDSVVISE